MRHPERYKIFCLRKVEGLWGFPRKETVFLRQEIFWIVSVEKD